jgi:hypothetical protein
MAANYVYVLLSAVGQVCSDLPAGVLGPLIPGPVPRQVKTGRHAAPPSGASTENPPPGLWHCLRFSVILL